MRDFFGQPAFRRLLVWLNANDGSGYGCIELNSFEDIVDFIDQLSKSCAKSIVEINYSTIIPDEDQKLIVDGQQFLTIENFRRKYGDKVILVITHLEESVDRFQESEVKALISEINMNRENYVNYPSQVIFVFPEWFMDRIFKSAFDFTSMMGFHASLISAGQDGDQLQDRMEFYRPTPNKKMLHTYHEDFYNKKMPITERLNAAKKYIDVCTYFYIINQDSLAAMRDILDKFDEYRNRNKRIGELDNEVFQLICSNPQIRQHFDEWVERKKDAYTNDISLPRDEIEKTFSWSGSKAHRGLIFQSIIIIIECLERNDWDGIKLEPNTSLDKVDIQLYKNNQLLMMIQVKSSINILSKIQVKKWLESLRRDAYGANEICLCLVGNTYTSDCQKYIWQERNVIKMVSLDNLESLYAEKLTKYLNDIGISNNMRVSDFELIVTSLFSTIMGNSIAKEPLSREAFEKVFRKALPVQRMPKILTTSVPLGPEIGLIGRNVVVDKVRAMLKSDTSIVLVSGLGGIGKTAVMAEICNSIISEDRRDTYVAWISCGESYIDDFLTLRQSLGVPKNLKREEAYEVVIGRLQDLRGTLYIFFDDMARVPDKAELGTYNALRPNVRIMITSRHEIKGIPRVDLKELEKDLAIDMFYDYYGKDAERKYAADAWEIINSDSVRSNTLLVELLAKAATSFGSLADFRKRLEKEGFLKVSRRKFDTGRFDNKTIEESVTKLYGMAKMSREQQRIMRLFSIFSPEKVIYGAIEEWATFDVDAVDGLVKLGWLDRTEKGFVIHQIIKDSLVRQVNGDLRIEDYGDLLNKIIRTEDYMPRSLEYTEVQERLLLTDDVAEYLWTRMEGLLEIENNFEGAKELLIDSGALFNNIAVVYSEQGDYERALEYCRKALAVRERVLGSDHPDTATTYNNMAGVFRAQGDYEKAMEYLSKALAIRERVLGPEHPSTAATYNNMASVFRAQGDYENAMEYYGKALAISERVSGSDHPDTAATYNNMAGVYSDQGEYDRALEYYRKALAISERVLGSDHPDTATTYNNMAGVYSDQGDYEKALEYYGKALAISERVLGPEHPSTATTCNNIAGVFYAKGDYEKALEYYGKALAISERILGTEHPSTATTYNNMAGVFYAQGDYEKALEYYGRTVAINERVLGTEHPSTATTYNNMAGVFRAQGDYAKAKVYYEKALEVYKMKLGEAHPYTQNAQMSVQIMDLLLEFGIDEEQLMELIKRKSENFE